MNPKTIDTQFDEIAAHVAAGHFSQAEGFDQARRLARHLEGLVTNLRWALEFVDEKTRLEGNRGAKVEQVLALALAKCRDLPRLTELPKCEMETTLLGP